MMVGRPTFGVRTAGRGAAPAGARRSARGLCTGHCGLPACATSRSRSPAARSSASRACRATARPSWSSVALRHARPTAGIVAVGGVELAGASRPRVDARPRVGRIPEDRHASLVGDLSVALQPRRSSTCDDFRRGRTHRRARASASNAEALIERFDIRATPERPGGDPVRRQHPEGRCWRACSRGSRRRSSSRSRRAASTSAPPSTCAASCSRDARARRGYAARVSEDLDELLALSDRLDRALRGHIVGELRAAEADPERLGLLMAGPWRRSPRDRGSPGGRVRRPRARFGLVVAPRRSLITFAVTVGLCSSPRARTRSRPTSPSSSPRSRPVHGCWRCSSRRRRSCFTGAAVAIAFRAGFWNIGAEGQLLAGAIAAAGWARMWAGCRVRSRSPAMSVGGRARRARCGCSARR